MCSHSTVTMLLDGLLVGAAEHNRGTAAVRKAARLLGFNLGQGGRVRRNLNHSTGSRSRRPKTPSQQKPGQSQQFLGVRVGIPALDGVESVLLPYTHFSVLMRLDKRLAAVTALGIDGTKLVDLDRSGSIGDWIRGCARTSRQARWCTPVTISTAATSSAGHQPSGAKRGRKLPGQTRTLFTTRTQPRRRPSLTREWTSGAVWSPTCRTTQPTTAGGSSFYGPDLR